MPRKYLHTDTGRVVSNVYRWDLRRPELRGDSLELSKEDGNHGVPLQVRERALLEEHVRLVDQHDGTPDRRDLEDVREVVVQRLGVGPQVRRAHHIQRFYD